MADKKLVEEITARDEDFAQWYTDVVKKAELVDYSSVKGCTILRPNGYAIWENIQKNLDARFKATGVENVAMPLFIPESLLQKEKDHVEGFAPEVAWVTHGGLNKLEERLCVRPTSETLFCDLYAKIIHSHRDLPKLYNQWCSVVRWEKTTRPFLRTTEFWWQEGHTAHATAEEAEERTIQMLNVYADFCREELAIPVIKGKKTDKEKFAGAESTYTIESLMHDGKALQSGTSHNFGDGFARAFGIQYSDKNNQLQYVHQTSWGLSTRIIGAIIMVHGDDSGLVLPPHIAPTQVMIIPIAQHKEGVLEAAALLRDTLAATGIRVKMDDSDKSPGWKFSEQEMHGIPLRIEIGPKDIEAGRCVLVRRDTREKFEVSVADILGAAFQASNTAGKCDFAAENAVANCQTASHEAAQTADFTGKCKSAVGAASQASELAGSSNMACETAATSTATTTLARETAATSTATTTLARETAALLETIQADMLARAEEHLNSHISDARTYDEFKDAVANKPGFVRAMWCGELECEMKIKEDTTATSRCMPFDKEVLASAPQSAANEQGLAGTPQSAAYEQGLAAASQSAAYAQEAISDVCVCCGKPAKKLVFWGKAY